MYKMLVVTKTNSKRGRMLVQRKDMVKARMVG